MAVPFAVSRPISRSVPRSVSDRLFGGSLSEAALFLAQNGPYGMVMDFSDASIAINDVANALDFTSQGQVSNGALVGPGAKLTYSAPSAKLTEQADGLLKFQAHNLALWSEDISNAAWNKSNVTVSGTVATATGAASNKFIRQLNLVSGGPSYSIQFDVAAGTHSLVQIYTDTPTTAYANFDLANGVLGTVGSTATATIEAIGGGIYRCTANFVSTGTNARLSFIDSTSAAWNATSSSTGTISVTRAHFRRTPSQSDYIATTSAAAYDLPYVYSGGVRQGIAVEPAATNLALRSTEFDNASWSKTLCTVTANAVTAPDGTVTADKIVEDTTAASAHQVAQTITTTAAAHTFSVFAKAGERTFVMLYHAQTGAGRVFNLSAGSVGGTVGLSAPTSSAITAYPNGWHRCEITVTATAASNSFRAYLCSDGSTYTYTGDGTSGLYLWGAQVETGTVATSPIITYGAAVARAADNTSEALADFPFTAVTGTWVVKYRTRSNALGCAFSLSASAGSDANLMVFYGQNGAGSCNLVSYDGSGVLQVNMTQAVNGADQWNTVAIAVEANNFAMSANGQPVVTDVSATVPAPTTLRIGSNRASNQHLNGDVQIIAYFTDRKSNAQLQELSAL